MDETYIKIKWVWHYLYRAVDKEGDTIDFMLPKKRVEAAAKTYFLKAIGSSGLREKVTINKSGSNNPICHETLPCSF
jgi:putative transposase